jgi:hypothetical protein
MVSRVNIFDDVLAAAEQQTARPHWPADRIVSLRLAPLSELCSAAASKMTDVLLTQITQNVQQVTQLQASFELYKTSVGRQIQDSAEELNRLRSAATQKDDQIRALQTQLDALRAGTVLDAGRD